MTADAPLGAAALAERVTRLCRALRERGMIATPAHSVAGATALGLVDVADRQDVYLALRTVLVARAGDVPIFDDAFDEWWGLGAKRAERSITDAPPTPRPRNPAVESPSSESRRATVSLAWRWATEARDAGDPSRSTSTPAPSAQRAIGPKDFSAYSAEELSAIERVAWQIARRLRMRRSRRWRRSRRGTRIDLRRVVRRALETGGEPIELARRERKPRRTNLVVLCDVSGSMDVFSRFLLQVVYALQHAFARVETFAFSTILVRITESLARDTYREALDSLARLPDAGGWSGGTRIGSCFAEFGVAWQRLVDRRTVVVVLSDGWDTGAPDVLGGALAEIHRRAGRVVWLNPLLGSPEYRPLTRGMQAALPHVDVFAPAHDLASLERLASHLSI